MQFLIPILCSEERDGEMVTEKDIAIVEAPDYHSAVDMATRAYTMALMSNVYKEHQKPVPPKTN